MFNPWLNRLESVAKSSQVIRRLADVAPDQKRVGLGYRDRAPVPREPRVPGKLQPVSVRLTRQQLRRTPADSTGVVTAQVPAVVQEELKQCQVVVPQLPPQEELDS